MYKQVYKHKICRWIIKVLQPRVKKYVVWIVLMFQDSKRKIIGFVKQ